MDDITSALIGFVRGDDTSLAAANRLEVLLDNHFPDDDVVQAAVVDLASYRPGGGDFLLDTPEMQLRLGRLAVYLRVEGNDG
jgi:hypothetical protein